MIRKAGIRCSDQELDSMEVADFGLSNLYVEGAEILPLAETEKVACRIIALLSLIHISTESQRRKREGICATGFWRNSAFFAMRRRSPWLITRMIRWRPCSITCSAEAA